MGSSRQHGVAEGGKALTLSLKSKVKKSVYAVAQPFTSVYHRFRPTQQEAADYFQALCATELLTDRVAFACRNAYFRSNQKRTEIERLLARVSALRATRICEIGADLGGTMALFASVAEPTARLLSIDLHYHVVYQRCHRCLARSGQHLTCLEADSHRAETLSKVKAWLDNKQFDFLFIDGDHSHQGVAADYEMYGPLVRSGGIIAFHDITPDFRMRYGRTSAGDVGEVPIFWNELRSRIANVEEFVEDSEQDGYGIGLVHVP
jgi:predicted O-methyltransferase YrrM